MNVTIPSPPAESSSPAGLPPGPDDALREAAIARLKRKRRFVQDVSAYVAVNGVLWLIWALTDRSVDGGMPWPAWVSVIWGFLLGLDAWKAYGRWPRSVDAPITDEEIAREIERERRR